MAPGGRLIDLGDVYFLLRRQEDRPDERNKDYGRNDQETGETNPVAGHELERRAEPGQDPTDHRVSETAFAVVAAISPCLRPGCAGRAWSRVDRRASSPR